jgi:hypothetical protein
MDVLALSDVSNDLSPPTEARTCGRHEQEAGELHDLSVRASGSPPPNRRSLAFVG